jgi:hypothetical protein
VNPLHEHRQVWLAAGGDGFDSGFALRGHPAIVCDFPRQAAST